MSIHFFTAQTLNELYPGKRWRIPTSEGEINLSNIIKEDEFDIDEDLVNEKIQEKLGLEPMRLLREERNRRLAETDWWGFRETDGRTMTQEQKDYRNALRDLPSTSTPSLDSHGNLENVTWPVKPE